jgi:hypothetical protein
MKLKTTIMKSKIHKHLNKSIVPVSKKTTTTWVRLVLIGLIIATGFTSCVVYAHPYHHYYHHW